MTRRDTDGYRAHRQALKPTTDPLERQRVTAAHGTVALARARLHEVRRQFIRRECGATDVATAEHELSRALDQLDHAAGTGWRT